MNDIFDQTVWALTEQVRAGIFVPEKFEVSFYEMEDMGALNFSLADDVAVRLTGRIDRVDVCERGDGAGIKIIDYKSGGTQFDLIKLYYGLQLQLVLYMNAALEQGKKERKGKDVVCAGMLYYHIDDPVLDSGEELLQALCPDGLVNSDRELYLAMDEHLEGRSQVIPVELKKSGELSARSHVATTEEFALMGDYAGLAIRRQLADIYSGDVSVNPYQNGAGSSCTYCPYKSVCGIDAKLPGIQVRRMEKLEKEEVFERMRTETARGERSGAPDGKTGKGRGVRADEDRDRPGGEITWQ